MFTYIFYEEANEYDPSFEIKADGPDEAFDIAYETYGPCVEELFCKRKHQ